MDRLGGNEVKQYRSRRDILRWAFASVAVASILTWRRSMADEQPAMPQGPFKLPDLPYPKNALLPYVSAETLHYHHDKHHAAYVKKLNELTVGTKYASMPIEEIIKVSAEGPLYNIAAQHWNHSFYWKCMSPPGGGEPSGALEEGIARNFGSFAAFKKQFSEAAMGQFGSGWAWLVKKPDGKLAIEKTPNADTPLARGEHPLLTCDVWEHAYYIDYRNERGKYIDAFWKVVNWEWVASNNA